MSTTDKAYFVVAHYKHLLKRAEETGHTQFAMHYSELQIILDQLDAERQRADDCNKSAEYSAATNKTVVAANCRLQEEIAELKGDQVPVYQMYYDGFWRDVDKEHYELFKEKGSDVRLLLTAPQKPVSDD